MKTIACWHDLSAFGIRILTGEACGLTYRYLCDVTGDGKHILEKCFDVRLNLAEPWNSGAVGSIMLPPQMLTPIGVFALLESGCVEVWWLQNESLVGIEKDDTERTLSAVTRKAKRRFAYTGTAGSRNRHEFTGRIT